MKINYGVTGTQRKTLVNAISTELNTSAEYLGAPTFAYQVGDYHIDKNGILEGKDNPDLVADLQGLHDFKPVSEEYDTPHPEMEPIPDGVVIPYEAEVGGRVSPYRDHEEPPAYGIPESADANSTGQLCIEMPIDDFTEQAIVNLENLIESKSGLIKKAICADSLPVNKTEDRLGFPWFAADTTGDAVKAYTKFIAALCDMAKTQKRVTAKEKPVDNEKFAFRCFLLRLGFIGDEFKAERKVLLSRLTGNSAFKSGSAKKEDEACTE